MGYLEFCSNCGSYNRFGKIDGNQRFFCSECDTIHYENPKPTATLICPRNNEILLVKRAVNPGRGLLGLPGGFIEKGESPSVAAKRELMEETGLDGSIVGILGVFSHYNTIFGDILLIGMEIEVKEWSIMVAGDDAEEAKLFPLDNLPNLAFLSHEKIVNMYREKIK